MYVSHGSEVQGSSLGPKVYLLLRAVGSGCSFGLETLNPKTPNPKP